MKNIIEFNEFNKVDIRVGTILDAKENHNLKKPSIVLTIDFGEEIGVKKSSAQLRENYSIDKLTPTVSQKKFSQPVQNGLELEQVPLKPIASSTL